MSRWQVLTLVWLLLSLPVAMIVGKVLREGRAPARRLRRGDAGRAVLGSVDGDHGRRRKGIPPVRSGWCPTGTRAAGASRGAAVALGHSRPPHLTSCPFGQARQATRRYRTRGWTP